MSLISAPALEKTRHLNKVPYLFFTLPWRNDVLIKLEGLSKVYQLFGKKGIIICHYLVRAL